MDVVAPGFLDSSLPKALNILVSSNSSGNICFRMFGMYLIGNVRLGDLLREKQREDVEVLEISFSNSLSELVVLVENVNNFIRQMVRKSDLFFLLKIVGVGYS